MRQAQAIRCRRFESRGRWSHGAAGQDGAPCAPVTGPVVAAEGGRWGRLLWRAGKKKGPPDTGRPLECYRWATAKAFRPAGLIRR